MRQSWEYIMDEILGFLFFIIIMAVSIISKARKERKAAENRTEELGEPISPKDLPEVARRMLFGDGEGDIIVAKPKQSAQPVMEPGRTPRETAQAPVPARQVIIERPDRGGGPRIPGKEYPVKPALPSTVQQRPKPQVTRPQQRPRILEDRSVGARQQPRQVQGNAPPPVAAAVAGRPAPAKGSSPARIDGRLNALLRSRTGLAQGILLREILGPPRSLEDIQATRE